MSLRCFCSVIDRMLLIIASLNVPRNTEGTQTVKTHKDRNARAERVRPKPKLKCKNTVLFETKGTKMLSNP